MGRNLVRRNVGWGGKMYEILEGQGREIRILGRK
jgi:hypothetical protein